MTVKDIKDECTNYIEDGYLSDMVEENDSYAKLKRQFENLYNLLTPAKRNQLDFDVDDMGCQLKEWVTETAERAVIDYRNRLTAKVDITDPEVINSKWLRYPELLEKSV